MPLYPLGISRCRDVPSVPRQAAGAVNMRWSLAGELACAYIDAPHQAVPPMLHAASLDAIHRRISVLPLRFGTELRDESEIRALLEDRSLDLLDRLGHLEWTCEMGLRIAPAEKPNGPLKSDVGGDSCRRLCGCTTKTPPSAAAKPQTPLDYLKNHRTHHRGANENAEQESAIVQQFVESLHGCYRQWRKLQSSPSHPIRLAFLIERGREAAFRSRVENASEACRDWRCAVLGPWPPYSFA